MADVSSLPDCTRDLEPCHFSYFSSNDFNCSIHGAFNVSVNVSKGVMLLIFDSSIFGLSLVCGDGDCLVYELEADAVDDDDEVRDVVPPTSVEGRCNDDLLRCGDFDERSEGEHERGTLLANDGNGNDSGVLLVFFSLAARRLS